MRKFFVPIDGSENSLRAVHYAVSLARDERPAEVYVATVQPEPFLYGEIAVYVDRDKLERERRNQGEAVLRPAVDLLAKAGIRYQKEILTGGIAESIVRCAEELKCDVIVMGTRGMAEWGNLVMGSVTTKVIHLTKLPVTLIK
ncbi:MAG: universal stress protein [Sulfurifustis sp.]